MIFSRSPKRSCARTARCSSQSFCRRTSRLCSSSASAGSRSSLKACQSLGAALAGALDLGSDVSQSFHITSKRSPGGAYSREREGGSRREMTTYPTITSSPTTAETIASTSSAVSTTRSRARRAGPRRGRNSGASSWSTVMRISSLELVAGRGTTPRAAGGRSDPVRERRVRSPRSGSGTPS